MNGESKALIVFTYSDKDKTYTTYPIMPGGNPAGKGKLVIEGNIFNLPMGEHGEQQDDVFPGGEYVHGSEEDRVPAGILNR